MPWIKETTASAKINLYLDITGKRTDAYHTLDTVMQSIDMADQIRAQMMTESAAHRQFNDEKTPLPPSADLGPALSMSIEFAWFSKYGEWQSEESILTNTCYKAAKLFWLHAVGEEGIAVGPKQRLLLRIQKRIPMESGLGGGSADAAALLELLWNVYGKPFPYQELKDLAVATGADVAFCMEGGTKYCTGIGDEMKYLPELPAWELLIVKPNKGSNTSEAFRRYDEAVAKGDERVLQGGAKDAAAFRTKMTEIIFNSKVSQRGNDEVIDLSELQELGGNVFVPLVEADLPELMPLLNGLQKLYSKALTSMTGSGTACFALFGSRESGIDVGQLHRMLDEVLGQGEYRIFRTRLKRAKL